MSTKVDIYNYKGGIYVGILYVLLFTGAIRMFKFNPKKASKTIRKEIKFWIKIITELVELINIIFRFVFTSISTIFKKNKVLKKAEEVKNDKIIDLAEYKLKKVK